MRKQLMTCSFWEVKSRETVFSAYSDQAKLLSRTDAEAVHQTSRGVATGIVRILLINLSLSLLLLGRTSADTWKALEETFVGSRHY